MTLRQWNIQDFN